MSANSLVQISPGVAERQAKVRVLRPRPSVLDAWLKANERSTRR